MTSTTSTTGPMPTYCEIIQTTLFPSQANINEKQIEKIDASLATLYENQIEKTKKLKELKRNLGLLKDKNNKIDPNGLPRSALIANTEKRMKSMLIHTKGLQQNIHFFEQVKYNLENSQITSEMANQIKSLKAQLVTTGAIDIDKLKDDVDDIADINEDMQEINLVMKDTMTNAWNAEMGDADEMFVEFMADSDAESETEEFADTTAPMSEYVEPIINPNGSFKSDTFPTVPNEEEIVLSPIQEEEREATGDSGELVHDF